MPRPAETPAEPPTEKPTETPAETVRWTESGQERSARWRSENGSAAPTRVVIADDRMAAATAYRLACEGTAILWRGGFVAARRLLRTMGRRADRRPAPAESFHLHRRARSQRARVLGMVLVPLDPDLSVPLPGAPEVRQACAEVYGEPGGPGGLADGPSLVSLRELLGLIGAHEWRVKGVPVPALGGERVHPHYGVFSPVRGEYVDLVAQAPLPSGTTQPATSPSETAPSKTTPSKTTPSETAPSTVSPSETVASEMTAFDIGTGTGVLAAVLARRGVGRVVATDLDPRALACASANLARLGLSGQVEVVRADLFPPGRADLVVCNPPWLPARPATPLDHAVYDPDSRMLRAFLTGLPAHLAPGGEGWLILSDLAEHLGLRTRAELLAWFEEAGLRVVDRLDTRPHHPRATDEADPLHAARAAEVTSLWRLTAL